MLVTGIKSKPTYTPLRFDAGGRHHLMVGQGVGREPLLRVLADMPPDALQATRVLYVDDAPAPAAAAQPFEAAGVRDAQVLVDVAALLDEFRRRLDAAFMGTRLYVAGPENFIGRVLQIALRYDLNKDEILAEDCGTRARRVYCIHCRATLENVRTNIVSCSSCGRWLLVRDHYSRRLAAYMGVMVDAEVPGELPPIEEVFA
jgi:NAD(P)H-flavin reductase